MGGRQVRRNPLKRQKATVLTDRDPTGAAYPFREVVKRVTVDTCELCHRTDRTQVHHIRRLADLAKAGQPQPEWARLMKQRRRKSLVVCHDCHQATHSGPCLTR